MERIKEKLAIEIFNSPKRTLKLLDKTLKKDETEIFITSQEQGSYSIFDKDNLEVCMTNSVYNSLIGLLYFNYGVGKSDLPTWAMPQGENNFENLLDKVETQTDKFLNLEKAIDAGGTFYYNSSKDIASFKLPEEINFEQNIAFRCACFSEGIEQMNSLLSVLSYDKSLDE